jgi:two-component system chemotaxis sensor kinase CheA
MIEQALQQLDALSMKLVAGVTGPRDAIDALAAIERLARNAGQPAAADTAKEMAAEMARKSPAETSQQLEATLSKGLENLRRTLENPPVSKSAPASSGMPAAITQDPELIGDFINESRDHLSSIETQVLALERDPESADPLHAAFRSFHTIKGLAGFLELADIREVSHEVETLLDRARNRELAVTPEMIDVVLESADYLKRAIAWVEAGLHGTAGKPPAFDDLLTWVRAALNGEHRPKAEVKAAEAEAEEAEANLPESSVESPSAGSIAKPSAKATDTQSEPRAAQSANPEAFTLRVDASKLDYMMDMVGELVIAQSLVTHSDQLKLGENQLLQRNLQQLGRITGEVQRMAMALRMTPVNQLFSRMSRLVRDMSRKNGKKVRLDLFGEETELDKAIIEQISDPLMHMVRNSLDHGLELPAERAAKGKNLEGVLRLGASHQAGHIVIEISDDGRGLNTDKILKKAKERGLVSEGQNLSENEIFYLIFEPGFSTADQITDVSGRGVGMDVVKRHIQSLRGRIDIRSERDKGSSFFLKVPLTLAIVDGLIVKVGPERYILPISTVREMLRPTSDTLFTIEGRAEMAMIRNELLPIVRLGRRFGVGEAIQNPCEGLFVVAESEGHRFCLLVDAMLGKQEVVIKSLGETFRNISGISGGAILGDGRVGLILDVNGIFREHANA